MKTSEVLEEVLAGKRLAEKSKISYKLVLRSVGNMYEEFPTRQVEVRKWLVSLEGFADQTVKLWFTILRLTCQYMADNYDMVNPCKGLKTPKVRHQVRRYFKADELMKVLKECRNEYDLALVTTLIDSGCRVGGLPGLKGSDVGESGISVKEKTGERKYRLDSRICMQLKKLAGSDEGLVFGRIIAGRENEGQVEISASALSMKIRRLCVKAGMKGKKLGAHTMRHSSASLVAKETKNALAVKAVLQHDDIRTSMLYIHDVEEDIAKGISPLQLAIENGVPEGQAKQKQLPEFAGADGEAVETEKGIEDNGLGELMAEMFPEVKDGVSVRPLLKTEDLRLMREIMIRHAMDYQGDIINLRGRDLLKRMVRKVK